MLRRNFSPEVPSAGSSQGEDRVPISPRDRRIAKTCSETTEPCIVFRGKDRLLPEVLEYYHDALIDAGAPQDMIDSVEQRHIEVVDWQRKNPDQVKTPDLRPGESLNP